MRTNDKIWAALNLWLEAHRDGRPNYIALPPADFRQLTEELNHGLPASMRYIPSKWNNLPVVEAPHEKEIRCLP